MVIILLDITASSDLHLDTNIPHAISDNYNDVSENKEYTDNIGDTHLKMTPDKID